MNQQNYTPPPYAGKPGGSNDNLALLFGILSLLCSSCLGVVSLVLSALAAVRIVRFRRAGGAWGWSSSLALASAILGAVFGLFVAVLLIVSFVRQDPDSIFGLLQNGLA